MTKKVIILIFLILSLQAQSQNHTDSLWSIWQQEQTEDSTRLEALFQICNQPAVIADADSLEKYAMLLFENASNLKSERYLGLGYLFRSRVYSLRGDYNESLILLDSSRFIFNKVGDKFNEARSLSNAASTHNVKGNTLESIKLGLMSLKLMEEIENVYGLAGVHSSLGMIYGNMGLIQKQIYHSNKGLEYAQQSGDKGMISQSMHVMAHVYVSIEDHKMAREYHLATLQMMTELGSKASVLGMKRHIAAEDIKSGNYLKAIEFLNEYLADEGITNSPAQQLIGHLNIAEAYAGTKDYENAMYYVKEAKKGIQLLVGTAMHDPYSGSLYKVESRIAMGTSNYAKAIEECQKWLVLAPNLGGLTQERDACNCLYEAYKGLGNGNKALEYKERYSDIQDSIDNLDNKKKTQQMEFARQLHADSLKQAEKDRLVQVAHDEEVERKDRNRNIAFGSGFLLLIFAGGLYSRLRYVRKSKAIIEEEKDRSNNLLLNILPSDIAEELKIHGKAEARDFDMVSILFTDFKDFTSTSEKLSAQELVSEINTCFEAFDATMAKYNIEKIKTIGDAYMAAGGLPVPTDDSVKNTVLAGLEMQDFIDERKAEMDKVGKPAFEMRVGIHTGPVVAGIVGVKKFQYDIWGDTVNTASRIESNGKAGKVNISHVTYQLLKDDAAFSFESRGKVEAKGKGAIDMYFVALQ